MVIERSGLIGLYQNEKGDKGETRVENLEELVNAARLFDFDQEIYGHYVEIHFMQKIRDEMCFQSLEALKMQIADDIIKTKKIFAELKRL